MPDAEPTIQTMKISEVKAGLSSLVNAVYRQKTRILVEKSGIPVAALVSIDDLRLLSEMDEQRAERFAVVDQMREAFKDIPPDEIERDVVAIIREMREAREAAIRSEKQVAAERRLA